MGNASLCLWHFNFMNRNFNILSIAKPSTRLKAHKEVNHGSVFETLSILNKLKYTMGA